MNLEKINVGGNEYDICDAKTRAMVSDEYDPEGDYVAGDLCIHDNKLHEAKGPTTGAWDSTKWEGRTLAEVLKSQNSKIEGLNSSKQNAFIRTITGDLNDYLSLTFGYTASNVINKPPVGNGYVEVLPDSSVGICLQRYTAYNSLIQYERWYLSGAWGDWIKTRGS